ncbi:MAG: GAF domain-containing protein [Ignavibacteria bacterium]|nr:GAF domain-containing protein [Ignavibacteria bacterium]
MKQTRHINPVLAANIESLGDEDLKFPFKRTLSFELLFDFMNKYPKDLRHVEKQMTEKIKTGLKRAPELTGAIEDLSVLQKHSALIHGLMSMVFPVAFYEKQAYAAAIPYSTDVFFSSPEFERLINMKDELFINKLNIDLRTYCLGKIISAYVRILHKFYDVHISLDFPMIVNFADPDTGLERYYKLNHAAEFVDIRNLGKLKKLSEEEKKLVQTNILNVRLLKELIPPENFEFKGFLVINAINVTDQEIVSSIKNDLLEKDTLMTEEGIQRLQHKIRSLLKSPELVFGFTEVPGHTNLLLKYGKKFGNSFILSDVCKNQCNDIKGSIYQHAFDTRNLVIIDDLKEYPDRTLIEDEILKQGIRNVLLAPLISGDKIIGILEIGSPTPVEITATNTLKLKEVLPLFAMTVSRGMEELNNKVQAIIKEECTAIHPSVEWRFRNAALDFIQKENEGSLAEMEEIIFKDVYPLYGLSDIRNSSVQRNEAIKEDLIENLNIANEIIHVAKTHRNLHALDELSFRIGKQIESIYFGLGSGDELGILNFLKNQIEPLFKHIKDYHSDVEESIKKYQKAISDELGFIYKRRKKYEDSVTKLNDYIGNYLEHEQVEAQEMFPHYFDKYKTDGVDYMMYIGDSLVEISLQAV